MNQEIALWALGILCALVGALMLIVLTRVLKQGDDTNAKVTRQGETLARVETAAGLLTSRVTSLDQWRNDVMQNEINTKQGEINLKAAEILELRRAAGEHNRRHGDPDRRVV